MPALTGPIQVFSTDIFSSSATQAHRLGQYGETRDGRRFRYCQAGASALVVGDVIQSAAVVANHINCSVTATALGATSIAVTPGATAGAANLYADGYAVISTTPGLGYSYEIDRHAAISSSTEFTLYLKADSAIQVALTTSSKLDLQINPYKNVIQTPATTLTGAVVGVAVYPIVAGEYGWIQTKGPGAVLVAGTPGAGLCCVVPASAAGAVIVDSAAAAFNHVGYLLQTGVDAKVKACMININ